MHRLMFAIQYHEKSKEKVYFHNYPKSIKKLIKASTKDENQESKKKINQTIEDYLR